MADCVVIGGGAAGMMAAYSASAFFDNVILLEKNEKLGKKLYITGKGRCNVCNNCDPDDFFANVVHNGKFMYSAFYGFDNHSLMDLIESTGCELKIERGGRVFPVSDHSSDIIRAVDTLLKRNRVKVLLRTTASDITVTNTGDGRKRVTGVRLKNGEEIRCDRVIVATGGLSYPSTGSTGDGHRLLEKLGHEITACSPSLVPFNTKETWPASLKGLTLKNVSIRLDAPEDGTDTGKKKGRQGCLYEGFGEMLFTHFGVSGPLILSASAAYSGLKKSKDCILHIDLKPALSREQLDKRILRDFDEARNMNLSNGIKGLLPAAMIQVMIKMAELDPTKKINEITREERERLIDCIKDLKLTVTGCRGYEEAVITRGGVSVKEIDPSTMESKLIEGLYVAGELLDVDALTGGYNLQIAWSTGYLAGIDK